MASSRTATWPSACSSWWVFLVLYVAFWLALATLFSVVFRRAATALLAVLAVWLVVTFFGGQIAGIIANTISPSTDVVATQVANVNLHVSLCGCSRPGSSPR